jgi:hypothetical protein
MRRSRFILLVASAGLLTGGALAACSSSSGDNTFDQTDSGTDATVADTGTDSAPPRDASTADVFVPPGSCPATTLAGSCDLVLQNCGAGKECDPIQNSDGTVTAQCEPAGSGSVPLGHECCQNAANNGDCVTGTFCNAACADPDAGAGTKSGRCAPFCCAGDNTVCGSSNPEGIKGICNVTSVGTLGDGGSIVFGDQCTYDVACKPFDIQPCTDTTASCLLGDDLASFKCSDILSPPGVAAGGGCSAGNACQSGLECLGNIDGGASVCTVMCFIDAGSPPFDAGLITNAVGHGGCPSGQSCNGFINGGPVWYGTCNP